MAKVAVTYAILGALGLVSFPGLCKPRIPCIRFRPCRHTHARLQEPASNLVGFSSAECRRRIDSWQPIPNFAAGRRGHRNGCLAAGMGWRRYRTALVQGQMAAPRARGRCPCLPDTRRPRGVPDLRHGRLVLRPQPVWCRLKREATHGGTGSSAIRWAFCLPQRCCRLACCNGKKRVGKNA